jgi:hypothetical protein
MGPVPDCPEAASIAIAQIPPRMIIGSQNNIGMRSSIARPNPFDN